MASRLIFYTLLAACVSTVSSHLVLLQARADSLRADALSDAFGTITPGSSAVLTEAGYQKVAALKSDAEMKKYVKRVLKSQGKAVANESDSELNGFVAWYSGEKATQTLDNMVSELQHASWVVSRGSSAPPSVIQTIGGNHEQQMLNAKTNANASHADKSASHAARLNQSGSQKRKQKSHSVAWLALLAREQSNEIAHRLSKDLEAPIIVRRSVMKFTASDRKRLFDSLGDSSVVFQERDGSVKLYTADRLAKLTGFISTLHNISTMDVRAMLASKDAKCRNCTREQLLEKAVSTYFWEGKTQHKAKKTIAATKKKPTPEHTTTAESEEKPALEHTKKKPAVAAKKKGAKVAAKPRTKAKKATGATKEKPVPEHTTIVASEEKPEPVHTAKKQIVAAEKKPSKIGAKPRKKSRPGCEKKCFSTKLNDAASQMTTCNLKQCNACPACAGKSKPIAEVAHAKTDDASANAMPAKEASSGCKLPKDCLDIIDYAKNMGIKSNPQYYPGLDKNSTSAQIRSYIVTHHRGTCACTNSTSAATGWSADLAAEAFDEPEGCTDNPVEHGLPTNYCTKYATVGNSYCTEPNDNVHKYCKASCQLPCEVPKTEETPSKFEGARQAAKILNGIQQKASGLASGFAARFKSDVSRSSVFSKLFSFFKGGNGMEQTSAANMTHNADYAASKTEIDIDAANKTEIDIDAANKTEIDILSTPVATVPDDATHDGAADQSFVAGKGATSDCKPSAKCAAMVRFARHVGIKNHASMYPNLSSDASFEEVRHYLAKQHRGSSCSCHKRKQEKKVSLVNGTAPSKTADQSGKVNSHTNDKKDRGKPLSSYQWITKRPLSRTTKPLNMNAALNLRLKFEEGDSKPHGNALNLRLKHMKKAKAADTTLTMSLVGNFLPGPDAKWAVGGAVVEVPDRTLWQCYNAVLADPECSKDYFVYSARGNKDCGCKTSTAAMTNSKHNSKLDCYQLAQADGTTFRMQIVGNFLPGPDAKWAVGGAVAELPNRTLVECYNAVMADSECIKDYFVYSARGNKDCGCKTSTAAMTILKKHNSKLDCYQLTQAPTTESNANGDGGQNQAHATRSNTNDAGGRRSESSAKAYGFVGTGFCETGFISKRSSPLSKDDEPSEFYLPAFCKFKCDRHASCEYVSGYVEGGLLKCSMYDRSAGDCSSRLNINLVGHYTWKKWQVDEPQEDPAAITDRLDEPQQILSTKGVDDTIGETLDVGDDTIGETLDVGDIFDSQTKIATTLQSQLQDLKTKVESAQDFNLETLQNAKSTYELRLNTQHKNTTFIRSKNAAVQDEIRGLKTINQKLREQAGELKTQTNHLREQVTAAESNLTFALEFAQSLKNSSTEDLQFLQDLNRNDTQLRKAQLHNSALEMFPERSPMALLQFENSIEPTEMIQSLQDTLKELSMQENTSLSTLDQDFQHRFDEEAKLQESLLAEQQLLLDQEAYQVNLRSRLEAAVAHLRKLRDYLSSRLKNLRLYSLKLEKRR